MTDFLTNAHSVYFNFSHSERKKEPKPHRPCYFCSGFNLVLSRHIMQVHKNEDLVKNAMRKPRKERISILDDLKKKGIE